MLAINKNLTDYCIHIHQNSIQPLKVTLNAYDNMKCLTIALRQRKLSRIEYNVPNNVLLSTKGKFPKLESLKIHQKCVS